MSEAQQTPADATPPPAEPATPAVVAPKPAAPATEAPATPETPEVEAPEVEQGKAGREAAKYRTQLRTVEAERDTLTATADGLRKALIAASLPTTLAFNTELFWKLGEHQPADFFGEDGKIDTAKLEQAARATMTEYHVGHQRPEPIPSSGTGTGAPASEAPTWGQAIGKK